MKRVLMIAFHFPPMVGSSGIQRALRFAQYLPQFEWEPTVLTARAFAYEQVSLDSLDEIPPNLLVRRAVAFDATRHLSIGGRYLGALARPDRWISWKFDAVRQGLELIRSFKPHAIWSTYPIATAHVIGHALHRRSGLPWMADLRDPMAQVGYPEDAKTWRAFEAIERMTIGAASCITFTTPGAARMYSARYPHAAARIRVLENGYDEEAFAGLPPDSAVAPSLNPGTITLLHSGIVYPVERDPTQLFAALRLLKRSGRLPTNALRIRFRAAVHDEALQRLAKAHEVGDFVETLGPTSYRSALLEMQRADGLLVLQASNCNAQIPAKLYEYLRSARPVLALTDPAGDTAAALRQAGLTTIAPLDSPTEIARALTRFVDDIAQGRPQRADPTVVASASRLGRTARLAELLDSINTEGTY